MRRPNYSSILASQSSWDIGDDWDTLSSDSPENAMDGASIYNIDPVMEAAREINYASRLSSDYIPSVEDDLITEAVDTIYSQIQDPDAPTLYDTKETFDQHTKTIDFSDELGREISLLVRCNESPDDLLVSMGRKLPELTDDEKYSAVQILDQRKGRPVATLFFRSAIQAMFHMHASLSNQGGDELVFTPKGIASWMSKSLGEEVGQHDKRITIVLAKYSTHGSGVLTMTQFEQLYMDAATLSAATNTTRKPGKRHTNKKKHEIPTMKSVWRDLENHGFQPPIMEERELLQRKIENKYGKGNSNIAKSSTVNIMDECEILEWKDGEHSTPRASSTSQMKGATASTKKSSHEAVALASDGKTPSRLRDGDFVFIDEESCIGCTQCANVASFSFHMLDNGRARTFEQSNLSEVDTAISVCPVSCMHKVAFHELEEMETARDVLGSNHGNIPLNVARIDSDANRKSSWYHTLKHKCFTSKSCPQRGCFDCPHFDTPGANPYFQKLHTNAEHVRAIDLIKSGEANEFRNNAEL